MSSLAGVVTNIGFVIASVLGLPEIFGTSTLWHYAYGIEIIPCVLSLVYSLFVLRESPKFYLVRNDMESALQSINYYYEYKNNIIAITVAEKIRNGINSHVRDANWSFIITDRFANHFFLDRIQAISLICDKDNSISF